MDIDSNTLLSYIEKTRNHELPDFTSEIQKSKGIKKIIRKVTFALTWWIVDPLVTHMSDYKQSNYTTLMEVYGYTRQLERAIAISRNELIAHKHIYEGFVKAQEIAISVQENALEAHKIVFKEHVRRTQVDYNQWIAQNEPTDSELKSQRSHKFVYTPTISLLLRATDAKPDFIEDVIRSVKIQTYSNWNLHIVSDVHEQKINECYASDERIKWHTFDKVEYDKSIIEFIVEKPADEFIGFLCANSTLAPFALFEMVKLLNENTEVDFIYGDEDEITDQRRRNPNFKPNFAPDTLRSTNYIGQFFVMNKNLASQISPRMEYTGDMLYEIVLHASELSKSIQRIPKILSHTIHPTSHKPHANTKLIKSHADRQLGLECIVDYLGDEGIYRVDYELVGKPKVSILIPNKDNLELLKPCIDSIKKLTSYDNYEIVIIENNSADDETFSYYKELEESNVAKILYYPEKVFNYQKIMNFAVDNCDTDYIMQLNNDMELLTPNWLELMLGFAQRSDVGAVSGRLYYPDMSLQHAGGILTQDEQPADHIFKHMPKYAQGYAHREIMIQNMSWVTGACLLCSKDSYKQAGLMTEEFTVDFGDVDFCMKLQAINKSIIYHPFVEFIHHDGATRGYDKTLEELLAYEEAKGLFVSKWQEALERGDPYNAPGTDKVLFP